MTRITSRRVVITSIGLVSPLGCGMNEVWERVVNCESGINIINSCKNRPYVEIPAGCNVKVLGQVPCGEDLLEFNSKSVFGRDVSKEMSLSAQYAIYAAEIAMKNANINGDGSDFFDKTKFGACIGSGGIGSINDITQGYDSLRISYKKLSPYFVPKNLANMAAGHVGIRFGLQGPIHSVATACASGTHSIGDAFNFIRLGYADAMLAGGSDASVSPLAISAFAKMKALSQQSAISASKPFDKNRDGFVMGEGAGILLLEELSNAVKRKAPIIAEIVAYSTVGDSYHITSPSPEIDGAAIRGMRLVMDYADIDPDEINYINAHATSTPIGDKIESNAIDIVFQSTTRSSSNKLYVSSLKGSFGHLLGAAGAVETAITALSIRDNIIPPTLNLETPDASPTSFCHTNMNPIKYSNLKYAIKNSFGFGGTNAVLLLKKYENN